MSASRVVCIGEILVDRLSREPGKPLEQVKHWKDCPGGAPANTACALTKLGIPTAFIGCVGQDKSGEMLVKLLNDVGVDNIGVQRHPTASTRIVYLVRDELGNSKFAGFGGHNPSQFADAYLQATQLPVSLFKEAEFLVLGTIGLAYPCSQEAIYKAIRLAKFYNTLIFLDVNWEAMFWRKPNIARKVIQELIEQSDFLKLTYNEAEFLFGTTDIKKIIKLLRNNIKGILMTANEQGCAYYLGQHEGRLPAFSVTVTDTTGAGDAFNAGVIYQICQYGMQSLSNLEIVKETIIHASAMGALTIMGEGAIVPQPIMPEIEAFRRSHHLSKGQL